LTLSDGQPIPDGRIARVISADFDSMLGVTSVYAAITLLSAVKKVVSAASETVIKFRQELITSTALERVFSLFMKTNLGFSDLIGAPVWFFGSLPFC
jgi:hypothetical protein